MTITNTDWCLGAAVGALSTAAAFYYFASCNNQDLGALCGEETQFPIFNIYSPASSISTYAQNLLLNSIPDQSDCYRLTEETELFLALWLSCSFLGAIAAIAAPVLANNK
jgi:hypothetical protein